MTSVPTTKPPQGFMMWMDPYMSLSVTPYQFEVVEIWRPGDTETQLIEPAKMHPATNVAALYWRPVKRFGETAQ